MYNYSECYVFTILLKFGTFFYEIKYVLFCLMLIVIINNTSLIQCVPSIIVNGIWSLIKPHDI